MTKLCLPESFKELLPKTIVDCLNQVLGQAGAEAVYKYLEDKLHLKLDEVAEKPGVFSASLERLLGSVAPLIENLILRNLYSELGLKLEEKEDYGFKDYIKELKSLVNGKKINERKTTARSAKAS